MQVSENIKNFGILFIIWLCLCLLLFRNGFPIGDDYKNQVIAFDAVMTQFSQGIAYPRWLPDVNFGLGGANLFFYPPLIYYVGFIFNVLSFGLLPVTTILVFVASTFLLASGLSCYLWLRKICIPRAALIGACVYMFAPYHSWIDLYDRNNMAEQGAYALLPLMFYFFHNYSIRNRYSFVGIAFTYSLLIFMHLPTVVFTTPFFLLYCALCECSHFKERHFLSLASQAIYSIFFSCLPLIIGAGIASIYLYPALSLLDTVRSHVLWGNSFYDYHLWFLWPRNQCPGQYGASCSLMFFISLLQLFIPAVVLILSLQAQIFSSHKHFCVLFILYIFCLFLMLPASSFIWELLPPLQKIQFPFRLMLLGDFLFASLLALALDPIRLDIKDKMRMVTILSLCAVSYISMTAYAAQYAYNSWVPPQEFFKHRIENKILTGEHFPKNPEFTLPIEKFTELTKIPLFAVSSGQASVSLISKMPRKIVLSYNSQTPSQIVIGQFRFRGWQAFLYTEDGTKKDIPVKAAPPLGMVILDVPSGQYRVSLEMPWMLEEKIGMIISLVSIFCLFLFLVFAPCVMPEKKAP